MVLHRLRTRAALPRRRTLIAGLAVGAAALGGVAVAAPALQRADPVPVAAAAAALAPPAALPVPSSAPPAPSEPAAPPTSAAPTSSRAGEEAAALAASARQSAQKRAATASAAAPKSSPRTTPKSSASSPPKAAPAPAAASGGGQAAAVVDLTNAERAENGCGPLANDARLAKAAQGHASDMASQGYFSHTSQDGRDFVARVKAAGYPSPGGENIARGQRTPAEVVQGWMDSAGHRANILNCSFTAIGVGFDARGNFWVQNFGR